MKRCSVEHSQRYLQRALIGALICVLLATNLVTPLFVDFHSEWLVAVFVGMCIGQVNLIAAWAALAPGNVLFRLPWSMLLGVLTWYSLVLGHRLAELLDSLGVVSSHSNLDMGETVLLGIILVVGIIVAQIPLWIAGRVFRWKLVCGDMPESIHLPQFNLRHLLLGMFLLSLVLGAARVILPTEERWSFHTDDELWAILGAVILCNLLITVPCIWGSFAPTAVLLPLAVAWTAYCAVLTLVEFGVLCLILGSPGNDVVEIIITFFLLNLSQCGTVLGSFLLLRAVGFRFVRLPITRKPCLQIPVSESNGCDSFTVSRPAKPKSSSAPPPDCR
ncbi:MAG: hypothetical protein H8E44_47745 [Planctomycetes bacterium]|nr:hypothetical protein [Planctomycetota bacterium]MBL7042156.1 hypothetical protein [Pirellulaceae bacterium]